MSIKINLLAFAGLFVILCALGASPYNLTPFLFVLTVVYVVILHWLGYFRIIEDEVFPTKEKCIVNWTDDDECYLFTREPVKAELRNKLNSIPGIKYMKEQDSRSLYILKYPLFFKYEIEELIKKYINDTN